MSEELVCPFCNKPLQPTYRSVDEYWCENDDCTGSSWKFGSISLWKELIRTRKALDVAEHRLVAEKMIGRFINKDEDVHHINGNKTDNRPENLMVLSHSDHMKLHKQLSKRGK